MIQLTGESNDSLHLTGWSLPLIENLNDDADDFRQVNSSVRFILNAVTQESESVILHVIEAQELSCMWMLLEGCEPRAGSAG